MVVDMLMYIMCLFTLLEYPLIQSFKVVHSYSLFEFSGQDIFVE